MKLRTLTVLVPALAAATVAAAGDAANLVPNGDLESGRTGQPRAWSPVDGQTTFWDPGGNPGRCLRFDTGVQQAAKKAYAANPDAPPPSSSGGKYGTVGAHEGVWAFSAPVVLQPDDRYLIIEADVKAPARSAVLFYPQVLVRGYQTFDVQRDAGHSSYFQVPHPGGPAYSEMFGKEQRPAAAGDLLMVYRHALVCRLTAANVWEHFRMGIKLPREPRYRPDVLLLKPYAYWPPGEYFFDNIRLRRVSEAEYNDAKTNAHSIKGFAPTQ